MLITKAIEEFVSGYFSTCSRSRKTQDAYQKDLRQFSAHYGGSSLAEISPEGIEGWAKELEARGYAPVSIRRKCATLRVFFAYWVRKGVLAASPFWRIRLDLGRRVQLPRNLAENEVKALIEQVWAGVRGSQNSPHHPGTKHFLALRNVAAVEVLFATGIRVGELVSLGTADWRDEELCFVIKGKGNRQRLAHFADHRSIGTIRRYLEFRRSLAVENDAFFLNAGGRRLSTQGIARLLLKLGEQAKIERRITPHMIRHTVATLLLRHGADIRIVQEVLGHSSIVTTQRYTHVSKEHIIATLRVHHPNQHFRIQSDALIYKDGPEPVLNWRE